MRCLFSIFLAFLLSCSFQPNNSDGIIVLKTAEDTLSLSIIDSYHTIKDFSSYQIGDTLFLNVNSIHSPDKETEPILIKIPRDISIVKIQNDKIINIESIPYCGGYSK
jgi:hypothetical protein